MRDKGESGFVASFDSGTCTDCGEAIEAGQVISTAWAGLVTRYYHVHRCPGALPITCSICGEDWYECECP